MEYTRLGDTGLRISRLALGCMSYGDPATPAAETMEALHDTVKAGKVRYIGASSMYAWQFAKLQRAAEQGGWTRFVSMQNQYTCCAARTSRS